MPPSGFSVLKNNEPIIQQNYVIHVKVIKQQYIAVTVNIISVHPSVTPKTLSQLRPWGPELGCHLKHFPEFGYYLRLWMVPVIDL